MEFEIEDRPHLLERELPAGLRSIQLRRSVSPCRPPEMRDRAVAIPEQECGS
jgi:hypothetical protein